MADRVKLPELPKPLRTSKHWDEGIEWGIAGERAARLEREDQLLKVLTDLSRAEARIEQMRQALDEAYPLVIGWAVHHAGMANPTLTVTQLSEPENWHEVHRAIYTHLRAALAAEEGKATPPEDSNG